MNAAKQLALVDLSNAELDARAVASVTNYGVGTKSYNSSAEKREMDRQRELITARYESGPRQEFLTPLLCHCPQRPYAHELSVHARIRTEKPGRYVVWSGLRGDPFAEEVVEFASTEIRWPWSLALSSREEPSTERKMVA